MIPFLKRPPELLYPVVLLPLDRFGRLVDAFFEQARRWWGSFLRPLGFDQLDDGAAVPVGGYDAVDACLLSPLAFLLGRLASKILGSFLSRDASLGLGCRWSGHANSNCKSGRKPTRMPTTSPTVDMVRI